ncbi:hypothetical protein D3C78_1285000 [compost metagenome]
MLKNRGFLLGLGSGIIIGSILFQLMLAGEQSKQNMQSFMDSEADQKLYSQSEVDAMLETERKALKESEQSQAEDSPPEAAVPPSPISSEPPTKEEDAAAVEAEIAPVPVQRVIRIMPGSGLSKTAALLSSNGIIEDENNFIKLMKKDNKLVRAGYFLFYEQMTEAEAIKVVTSDPLTESEAKALMDDN